MPFSPLFGPFQVPKKAPHLCNVFKFLLEVPTRYQYGFCPFWTPLGSTGVLQGLFRGPKMIIFAVFATYLAVSGAFKVPHLSKAFKFFTEVPTRYKHVFSLFLILLRSIRGLQGLFKGPKLLIFAIYVTATFPLRSTMYLMYSNNSLGYLPGTGLFFNCF